MNCDTYLHNSEFEVANSGYNAPNNDFFRTLLTLSLGRVGIGNVDADVARRVDDAQSMSMSVVDAGTLRRPDLDVRMLGRSVGPSGEA